MKVSSLKKKIESKYSILDDPFLVNQTTIEVGSEKEMGREQLLNIKDAFANYLNDAVVKPYMKLSTNLTKLRFLITAVVDDYTWETLIEPIFFDKLGQPKTEDFESLLRLFISGKKPASGKVELDESISGTILSAIESTISNRKSSIYDDFTVVVLRHIITGVMLGKNDAEITKEDE
jgi:hypothetical protein